MVAPPAPGSGLPHRTAAPPRRRQFNTTLQRKEPDGSRNHVYRSPLCSPQAPWHGLGIVLKEQPKSIDEALEKSGLGWHVSQGDVIVVRTPEWTDDFGHVHPPDLVPAETADGCRYRANLREDTGELLGIVSDDYRVVPNRDAFAFSTS